MDELSKIENYESYWDLINSIEDLCNKAMESGCMYMDDIVSALDRVKTRWITEHIKAGLPIEEIEEDE